MQWVAMLTMLIDHIGIIWFPESLIWRVIGRFAFPIYAYYVAAGMVHTSDLRRYLARLLILAFISQLPFSLLFQTWTINVIGTLFVSVAAVYILERMPHASLRLGCILIAAILMETISFDYGAYGLLLILIYRYTASHAMWLSHFGLNLIYAWAGQSLVQIFSLFSTLVFAYAPKTSKLLKRTVPRWLWRSFYPVHLLLLYLLSVIPSIP